MAKYTPFKSIQVTIIPKHEKVIPTPTRNDFLNTIVCQFVERRTELGLSQEELDAKMGNADRLISKWECGLRTPTSFNLYCWAKALECKLLVVLEH